MPWIEVVQKYSVISRAHTEIFCDSFWILELNHKIILAVLHYWRNIFAQPLSTAWTYVSKQERMPRPRNPHETSEKLLRMQLVIFRFLWDDIKNSALYMQDVAKTSSLPPSCRRHRPCRMFKRDAKSADEDGGTADVTMAAMNPPIFTLGTAKSDPRLDWTSAPTCLDFVLPLQDDFRPKCRVWRHHLWCPKQCKDLKTKPLLQTFTSYKLSVCHSTTGSHCWCITAVSKGVLWMKGQKWVCAGNFFRMPMKRGGPCQCHAWYCEVEWVIASQAQKRDWSETFLAVDELIPSRILA